MPTLKPYPAYADTDLPWLPKIPKHWDVKRLKQVADVAFSSVDKHSKEDEQPVSLCNYVDVYKNDHITSGIEFMQATASAEEVRKFTLKKDDVMITKDSESWNDIAVPAYVPEDLENVICGYHLALVRPNAKEVDGKFLFRALQARPVSYQFEVEATGITRYGIDQYAIGSTFFPIPPLPEQRTIAAYLDRQTAKVDALIAKKQRLLDLLAEQRAALINRVVTKGNARNNVQKDNGPAPWLFPLPAGWKREKLKVNSYMKGRIGYENLRSDEYTTEGPYLVSSAHFKDGKIEWDKCNHVTRERFEMSPDIILRKDDILFIKDGALMGKLAYVDELPGEACLNSHLLLIRPQKKKYLPKFLLYVLMTDVFEAYMIEERKGTTFFGFSQESMGNFPISLPPISEQKEICDYIDRKTKQLDDLAAKAESVIERLREYRAALISSVVTGKVHVK
ncbi:MAG: restriction endonuclease subunit S [Anaerolineales bacterium]|nr:restriction endonuclease subunit S [Anaerolineales bacterium]